ncbi:MAG: DUF1684 domain-containing protein [Bacteroidales bacterium]|nr:DUF1684 domain-containing protein [Bacteroidales bacterium]MCF8404744.1 DUF1684 domain-containing protein [Bacteroidales bacterium]
MKYIITVLFTGFIFLSYLSFSQISQDSINTYISSIENHRKGKNIKLMYTESTPLKPDQKKTFKGLNYFPANINYQLEATLIIEEEPEIVKFRTSTERSPEYIKYGKVIFTLNGKEYSLFAYQSKKLVEVKKENNDLFVPFRDETSKDETYGGGRYVDCEIPKEGNKIILDFNKAYNPYCAYNPTYSCVIPPEENRLPIRIEAGEKIYEKH